MHAFVNSGRFSFQVTGALLATVILAMIAARLSAVSLLNWKYSDVYLYILVTHIHYPS